MGQVRAILIVDDDRTTSTLLKEFLQQHNFLVYWVPSGKDMFAFLKEKNIDLVLLGVCRT